jgi:hypothetical protein
VSNNAGGGIEVASSNFTITNDLIVGNGTLGAAGSGFGGVDIASVATTSVIYNLTVVNNMAVDTPTGVESGITCGTTNVPVVNTVLLGNSTLDVTPTKCVTSTCAYLGAGGNGNVSLNGCAATDVFQGANNFELLTTANPGKSACILIDKGATPSAALNVPAHDLLGRSRPQRTAWDPGCYEEP